MSVPSKMEAVQKVGEALNDKPGNGMERAAPNDAPGKENFQKLLNVSQPLQNANAIPENKPFAPEGTEKVQDNPIFAEDNVSSQKSGTATDQEGKKKRQNQGDDEEVSGVGATGAKNKGAGGHVSLMDEVTKLNTQVSKVSRMSPEQLKAQANDVIAQIDQVKTQLAQTQGEIKPAYQTLLRNRLSHIDDNLKIALSKAGVEYTPPSKAPGANSANPLERFLGFLTNSQKQLEGLNSTIDALGMEKSQLTPANMLAIQMKMGYVQQQIELFTSLLNKALESTKSIMNIQV